MDTAKCAIIRYEHMFRGTHDTSFQNLAPIYEQLADAFSHAKDKVIIAKVDADGVGRPLGNKYDVKGFPSSFI